MQLTLTLPDDLVQKLKSIPDSDQFVQEVLQAGHRATFSHQAAIKMVENCQAYRTKSN